MYQKKSKEEIILNNLEKLKACKLNKKFKIKGLELYINKRFFYILHTQSNMFLISEKYFKNITNLIKNQDIFLKFNFENLDITNNEQLKICGELVRLYNNSIEVN